MKDLKVDVTKLYTQSEYAKLIGKTKGRVNQMINENSLNVVRIKGATLILVK